MIILSVDGATPVAGVAVVKDGVLLAEEILNVGNTHSEQLLPMVVEILEKCNISMQEVDVVVTSGGPGSFTGVRIGVTIAKTYGYLINKNITPVSSLKSLAISSKHQDIVMSIIMANRNNYYVGIYDNEYNEIIDEQFVSANKLLELIEFSTRFIISS